MSTLKVIIFLELQGELNKRFQELAKPHMTSLHLSFETRSSYVTEVGFKLCIPVWLQTCNPPASAETISTAKPDISPLFLSCLNRILLCGLWSPKDRDENSHKCEKGLAID